MGTHPQSGEASTQGRPSEVALEPVGSAGLCDALIAISCFSRRHKWKEKGSRRGLLRNHRVKDWSEYGRQVRSARLHIRLARAAGWRGSLMAACKRGEHLRLVP